MPLQQAGDQSYLKRSRVYVTNEGVSDGAGAGSGSSSDQYDFSTGLDEVIQRVVAVELVDWIIPRSLSATFVGRYSQSVVPFASTSNPRRSEPGTSILDVRVTAEDDSAAIEFPVDMELVTPASGALPYSYAGLRMTSAELLAALSTAIPLALDAVGHAGINTTNYTVNTGVDEAGRFFFNLHLVGDPAAQGMVELLLSSGPNREDSMFRVLGVAQEDSAVDATTRGFQSTGALEPVPLRYVDVRLPQCPELDPVARIFLSADFKQPDDKPDAVRLLRAPLDRLESLRVQLVLPGGVRPGPAADDEAFDLTFEVLSLMPEQCLPNWVDQRLLY